MERKLRTARETAKTKNPPVAVKRELAILPLALFSMKQTWATESQDDYRLVKLLNQDVLLSASKYWKLTPNAVAVTSSIAASAAKAGIGTLAFFQSIKFAAAAARQISELLDPMQIQLTDEEARLLEIARLEMGDDDHLYLNVDGRVVRTAAAVHHGLLLPEERRLCESLYRRSDGLKVLTATSTLAQGMNLPSELVIIGEDSRFDEASDRKEILQAQELLNAAGRAGRAGENASGIVLVVPGKVVGIDFDDAKIGSHWMNLLEIFGQTDQCLKIDDPLTAILDRVQVDKGPGEDITKYAILRLASNTPGDSDADSLTDAIGSSFAAFRARQNDDDAWIQDKIEAAINFFEAYGPQTEAEEIQSQVAASLGLSHELVTILAASIYKDALGDDATVNEWRAWFFDWMGKKPGFI